MRKSILTKVLAVMAAGAVAFAGMAPVSMVSAEKEQKQEVDLDGTYHARMGIQTSNLLWVMQMNYYKGQANETLGTELENKLFCADQEDNSKLVKKEGTFNEVEISGNGVYTVTLDQANFEGETDISQLHVATDIPLNDKIKFSNVKATINGRTIATFDEAIMEDETPYLEGGMVILVLNHWRESVVGYLKEHGCSETGNSGWKFLSGQGDENIAITFTVSGFNKDNPDAVEATATPKAEGKKKENSTGDSKSTGVPKTTVAGFVVGIVIVGIAVVVVVKTRKKK